MSRDQFLCLRYASVCCAGAQRSPSDRRSSSKQGWDVFRHDCSGRGSSVCCHRMLRSRSVGQALPQQEAQGGRCTRTVARYLCIQQGHWHGMLPLVPLPAQILAYSTFVSNPWSFPCAYFRRFFQQ